MKVVLAPLLGLTPGDTPVAFAVEVLGRVVLLTPAEYRRFLDVLDSIATHNNLSEDRP